MDQRCTTGTTTAKYIICMDSITAWRPSRSLTAQSRWLTAALLTRSFLVDRSGTQRCGLGTPVGAPTRQYSDAARLDVWHPFIGADVGGF